MKRNQLIAACLGSVFCLASQSWSSTAGQIAIAELTDTALVTQINKLAPVYTRATTDPVDIVDIAPQASTYDGATYAFSAATTPTMAGFDTSTNTLTVLSSRGGAFRTYSLVLTGPWNATTTLSLPETVRDGVSSPSSPESFNLIMTKGTGTPPDLTATGLGTWASGANLATALAASSTGTALTSTAAAIQGWTFKGYFADNGGTAQLCAMDPVGATLPLNVTPAGSTTAKAFSANITGLEACNVATNSTTAKRVLFSAAGGAYISFDFYPGNFARSASILTGISGAFTNMPKRLHQMGSGSTYTVAFKNDLATAVTKCLGMIASPAPSSVQAGLIKISVDALNAANTTSADTATTADTNKLGISGVASGALASASWTVDDNKVLVTGAYTGKAPLTFTGDLGSITSLTSASTPRVVQFVAKNGDTVAVVCHDSTGYDESSATALPTRRLAIDLYGVLNGVTSITSVTTAQAVTGSQS